MAVPDRLGGLAARSRLAGAAAHVLVEDAGHLVDLAVLHADEQLVEVARARVELQLDQCDVERAVVAQRHRVDHGAVDQHTAAFGHVKPLRQLGQGALARS